MHFYLIIFVGILAVASAAVLIKMCSAPAMVIATYRLAFASLFFLTVSLGRGINPLSAFGPRDLRLAALGGIFLFVHFGAWISSLKYISVATSVVLLATTPVFVGLASAFIFRERPARGLIFGILLTLSGTLVIGSEGFGSSGLSLTGNLLALAGAIGAGGYFLIGRAVRGRIGTMSYVAVVYSMAALLLAGVTLVFALPLTGYDSEIYLLFFLIAFIPQVIGHTSLNWALGHVSAATVSVIALGEPIGAPILAFFVLGETITAIQVFGGILILAGVVFALRSEHGQHS